MKNLKHGDKLLEQIVEGLPAHWTDRIGNLQVTFSDKEKRNIFVFSLALALEVIAKDMYWDETGDWSECDTARVDSI